MPVPSLWPLAKVSAHTKASRCPPPPADLRDLFRKPCSEGRGWLPTTECLPRFASQGLLMAAEDSPVENVGRGWWPSNHRNFHQISTGEFGSWVRRGPGSLLGGTSRSRQATAGSELAMQGAGASQERWLPPRLCRGTVAAVHPAFAPEPRDSGLPRTSLALPEPRASAWSRCVCGSSAFRLTQTAGIPPDFRSQFLWGRLLLALELWAGEPQGGAGAPCFSRGTSAAKVYLPMPSHRMWLWDRPVSHLCPSPQSDVASSLHPRSRRFCSASQLVLRSTDSRNSVAVLMWSGGGGGGCSTYLPHHPDQNSLPLCLLKPSS